MRKAILIGLVLAVAVAFAPAAMAKGPMPQFTCAPTILPVDTTDPAKICFDWDWTCVVDVAPVKYSIDVQLLVSGEGWDDEEAVIQKLSFCTGDRDDGGLPTDTNLCVPIEEFVYLVWDDGLGELVSVPFTGPARAKVKALGKGRSENNTFSDWSDDFVIGDEPTF
jgi:hypothetical protein